MPRFAANLSTLFTERPFLDRFEAAARAGFRAVECQFPYEHPAAEIRARLDAHGLEMVLHNLPPGDWSAGERGLAALPGREREFRAAVVQGLAHARVLGVPRLNALCGLTPSGVADTGLFATAVANLRHAADACADAGLELLVEPINEHDMPGVWLRRTAQALALIDAVERPNLRLQLDLYHAQRTGGDLAATLEQLLPRIGHVQIADVPGRHEPGTGELNWRFLFDHLDRIGYRGHVGCEYRPATTTEAGLGWRSRLS